MKSIVLFAEIPIMNVYMYISESMSFAWEQLPTDASVTIWLKMNHKNKYKRITNTDKPNTKIVNRDKSDQHLHSWLPYKLRAPGWGV